MDQPPPLGPFLHDAEEEAFLVERIRAGEREALSRAYDLYSQTVYTIALRISKDQRFAEEVLHEVFLSLWRNPLHSAPRRNRLISVLVREARHLSLMQPPGSEGLPERLE
jgi:RNA polymerase sigma-70 factor (ECF subfamily)